MQEIIIDKEFQYLLPPLETQSYLGLEANIITYGCMFPLVLWNSILVDGYHRYKICTEHNIPFKTIDIEFESREEATIWIIDRQISQRNLNDMQLSYFRGLHYINDKKRRGGDRKSEEISKSQSGTLITGATAIHLSEQYNVARNTILRDAKLAQTLVRIGKFSDAATHKILNEDVAINRAKLQALSNAPDDEIEDLARKIENDEYSRSELRAEAKALAKAEEERINATILPEIRQLNAIVSDFAGSFNSMLRKMETNGSAELKPVIRVFIDQLENLYNTIS